MDEWIYRQAAWTKIAEQVGEECQAALESVLATNEREFEIRDASILLAQLVLSDAATRYLSLNAGQHDARKKEAQKNIRGTVRGLLKGGDQADYLQGVGRWLGKYDRLGGVPVDGYRDVLAIASAEAPQATTRLVSDLIIHIERLSDIAYSQFKRLGQESGSSTSSGTSRLRLQFSDGKKRTRIPTKKSPKIDSVETGKQ